MKTTTVVALLLALALSACAPICQLDAERDPTLVCEFSAGGRCLQWARHRSLITGQDKFGNPATKPAPSAL